MNKLFTFLALALAICLTSCSNDDDDNNGENDVKKRIVKLDFSPVDGELYNFTYNSGGRLSSFTEENIANEKLYKFQYDSDGRMIRMDESELNGSKSSINYRTFEYKKDSVIATLYTDENTIEWADTLIFNTKDLVIKMQDREYIYSYNYDGGGNLISAYNGNYRICEFTYDSTKSIFLNMGIPSWYWIYFGEVYFWGFAGPKSMKEYSDYEGTISFDYKLDESGYPTEIYNDDVKEALVTYQTIK